MKKLRSDEISYRLRAVGDCEVGLFVEWLSMDRLGSCAVIGAHPTRSVEHGDAVGLIVRDSCGDIAIVWIHNDPHRGVIASPNRPDGTDDVKHVFVPPGFTLRSIARTIARTQAFDAHEWYSWVLKVLDAAYTTVPSRGLFRSMSRMISARAARAP